MIDVVGQEAELEKLKQAHKELEGKFINVSKSYLTLLQHVNQLCINVMKAGLEIQILARNNDVVDSEANKIAVEQMAMQLKQSEEPKKE